MKLNLLKPLKRIFTALSGEETEEKNLVTIIDKIADTVEESSGSGGLEKFVVTLTPNQPDGSGTMDKTVTEIFEAYKSGKNITFAINYGSTVTASEVVSVATPSDGDYPSFFAQTFDPSVNAQVLIYTAVDHLIADGGNIFGVKAYTLTPAT